MVEIDTCGSFLDRVIQVVGRRVGRAAQHRMQSSKKKSQQTNKQTICVFHNKLFDTIMDYNIASQELELADPNPDIWQLFRQFDSQFFEDTLKRNCVELSWSPRMTSTAGLCAWSPRTKFCSIRLSLPLLKLRSRKDLVETLLHEMIHGFLFVTHQDDNHESHGEKFHYHMYRINQMTGTHITVFHTFIDEVRSYQTHVWKCDGPCQNRPPYFGYVKRAMNRKPGPNDNWWKQHQDNCGGSYLKVAEPTKNPARSDKPSSASSSAKEKPKIDTTQKKISDYWSSIGPGRKLA